MNKLSTVISIMASIILLALITSFWVWLYHTQSFAFGVVEEVLATQSEYSVIILKQYREVAVAIQTTQLNDVKPGVWLLLQGAQWHTEQPVLFAESILVLPSVNFNLLQAPKDLLLLLSEHTLATVGFGLLLLFMAGRLLKLVHFGLLSGLLALTLWHGVFVVNAMGWLTIGSSEQALMYVSVVLFAALSSFNTVSIQQWPSRIIATILAYALGEVILSYFGMTGSILLLVYVFASAWLPVLFTATLAAFLLANALSASLLGAYLVLSLCLLISLSQLRFAPPPHTPPPPPPSYSRHYIKLKRKLKPTILHTTSLNGKVSLVDALKKRGVL